MVARATASIDIDIDIYASRRQRGAAAGLRVRLLGHPRAGSRALRRAGRGAEEQGDVGGVGERGGEGY